MAKKLPYYKMYPGDAEGDKSYRLMTLEERGLFWTLLNLCWINDGLPFETEELAVLVGVPEETFLRLWRKVGKSFYLDGSVLKNPRQEQERKEASESYARRRDAGAKGGNARAMLQQCYSNASSRAYDSDSGSVSDSSEKQEKQKKAEPKNQAPLHDELWGKFKEIYFPLRPDFIDDDFTDAYHGWKVLDPGQKLDRIAVIQERLRVGQWSTGRWEFIPKPKRYLARDYKIPVVAPRTRQDASERPSRPLDTFPSLEEFAEIDRLNALDDERRHQEWLASQSQGQVN